MEFDTFIETVKTEVGKLGGKGYETQIHKVLKNNGEACVGLVMKKEESREAPLVYLEPYYEAAVNGEISMEDVAKVIYRMATDFKELAIPGVKWEEFEEVKGRVFYRLVDYKRNRKLLEDVPFVPYHGLAIIFSVFVTRGEEGFLSSTIHKGHMEIWKTDVGTLYKLAGENTPRLFPYKITSMADIMKRTAREALGDEYDERLVDLLVGQEVPYPLYILGNDSGIWGAAAILYEGALRDTAKMLGADLFILPSSIHEVILLPYEDGIRPEKLEETVRSINATIAAGDVLCDRVYLYRRETDAVSPATEVTGACHSRGADKGGCGRPAYTM